jgi:catechol 2,3-dioxygenase-like lactoylglutathione lyase family enzyme
MGHQTGPEQERLAALVGRWRTSGWTRATPDAPALQIAATDTYEWLPGRFALLHSVDALVGGEGVEGAEIIGWDSERNSYSTLYFGSDGPNAYEATLGEEDGALVWRMRSRTDRFTGIFSDDGNEISGQWEQFVDGGEWRPWMEVTLTKQPPSEVGRLRNGRVATRLPAQDLERAKAFYAESLGLEPVEEREGGLRYVCAAGEFALFESAGRASGDHTQMSWDVDDIEATVRELRALGVVLEEYDVPGIKTVDGIATIEGNYPSKGSGERAAWFRDSEGNLLGIGEPCHD